MFTCVSAPVRKNVVQGDNACARVNKLRTFNLQKCYQLNSYFIVIFKPYKTKTLQNKPNAHCLLATGQFSPARRTQVWLTVGKQTGPGINVVKASHRELGKAVCKFAYLRLLDTIKSLRKKSPMRDHYFKNHGLGAVRGLMAALLAMCMGLLPAAAFAQASGASNGTPLAGESNCTVTATNRTAPLQADYSFTIYNIPGAGEVISPAGASLLSFYPAPTKTYYAAKPFLLIST